MASATIIERKTDVVDMKRVIAHILISQREIYKQQQRRNPGYVSIERIQKTIWNIRCSPQMARCKLLLDTSREAIEDAVIFNNSVLDLNEDAGLVYFRNKEPRSSSEDDEYFLCTEAKSLIYDFTCETQNKVY